LAAIGAALSALEGWPADYPASTLRAETRAMADAWVEVLLARLPTGALRGVHLKGSTVKPWDSPIDYVPHMSDVDVHVLLAADEDESYLDGIDIALEVNVAVLAAYRRRVPSALHLPRPQMVIANRLDHDPDILPSPASTVVTLYGEAYPDRALTPEEEARQRLRDREQLTQHLDFLAALALRAIDRPGRHLVPLVGELNWRVSPVAPRVLEVLGAPYSEAWSLNRTHLVAELRAAGLDELADAYAAYYLGGWRLFVEGGEGDAPLQVFRAGSEVIRLGAKIAEA
jgi:hypothetical protein